MHFLDVLHLYCVNTVDLGDETLWVAPQMVQVLRQGFLENSLLARVHCLDKEALVEGREHEAATLTS